MQLPLAEGLAALLTMVCSFSGAIVAAHLAMRTGWFRDPDPRSLNGWMGRTTGPVDGRPNAFIVFVVTLFVLLIVFSTAFDLLLVR